MVAADGDLDRARATLRLAEADDDRHNGGRPADGQCITDEQCAVRDALVRARAEVGRLADRRDDLRDRYAAAVAAARDHLLDLLGLADVRPRLADVEAALVELADGRGADG